MESLTIELTPEMLAMVPVVAAILQLAKRFVFVEKIKSFLPLIAIAISLGITYAGKMPDPILSSIIIGLTAVGGFELVKAPKKKKI